MLRSTLCYKVTVVTLFDLLFVALFFATAFSLVAAVWFALRHQLPVLAGFSKEFFFALLCISQLWSLYL